MLELLSRVVQDQHGLARITEVVASLLVLQLVLQKLFMVVLLARELL